MESWKEGGKSGPKKGEEKGRKAFLSSLPPSLPLFPPYPIYLIRSPLCPTNLRPSKDSESESLAAKVTIGA